MGLDYSQKRLVSAPLAKARKTKRNKRLQLYAFFTGMLSTCISLAHLLITALK